MGAFPKNDLEFGSILFKAKRFHFNSHPELNQDLACGPKYSITMTKRSPFAPVKIVGISLHSGCLSEFVASVVSQT